MKVTKRHVVNGEEVRFHGRLKGRQTGDTGKLIHLQVYTRGRWSTFATPRASRERAPGASPYRFTATRGTVTLSVPGLDPARVDFPVRDRHVALGPRLGARSVMRNFRRLATYLAADATTHLTYANVMATAAVFIALGGTSYAVTALPRNSVGSKQIRSNAVGTSELRKRRSAVVATSGDRTIQLDDVSLSARRSLRGQTGPAGPQGPPGPAVTPYTAAVNCRRKRAERDRV